MIPATTRARSSMRQALRGRPVLISSHAGPQHRGRVGQIMDLHGSYATVEVDVDWRKEKVRVHLKGLRLIMKPKLAGARP